VLGQPLGVGLTVKLGWILPIKYNSEKGDQHKKKHTKKRGRELQKQSHADERRYKQNKIITNGSGCALNMREGLWGSQRIDLHKMKKSKE